MESDDQNGLLSREEHLSRMRKDRFVCDMLGVKLTDAGIGYAKAELTLNELHLNGVGIVQGGVLFTLADYTFAAACNYSQEAVVGIETSVSFLKSSRTGTIYAEAHEISRTKRFSVCSVQVTDENNNLLIQFMGRGYIIQK